MLTAVTLEEAALFAFLGAVAVGYVASVAEAFARRRYLALLAGGVGTSLFIGCGIAFLRMWGLAFNQDPGALGEAVTTEDSDIYFYLAAASGSLTLLVLFAAAVWPSGRRLRTRPKVPARKPAPSRAPAHRPAARLPAGARQSPAAGQRTPARTAGCAAPGDTASGHAADRGTPAVPAAPAGSADGRPADIRFRDIRSGDIRRQGSPPLSCPPWITGRRSTPAIRCPPGGFR